MYHRLIEWLVDWKQMNSVDEAVYRTYIKTNIIQRTRRCKVNLLLCCVFSGVLLKLTPTESKSKNNQAVNWNDHGDYWRNAKLELHSYHWSHLITDFIIFIHQNITTDYLTKFYTIIIHLSRFFLLLLEIYINIVINRHGMCSYLTLF